MELNKQLIYKNLVYVLIPFKENRDSVIIQYATREEYLVGMSYKHTPNIDIRDVQKTLEKLI